MYVVFKVCGPMAQLVRAPPCHGGGRRFESDSGRYGVLAQLGEHLPYKQGVIGSSPIRPITFLEERYAELSVRHDRFQKRLKAMPNLRFVNSLFKSVERYAEPSVRHRQLR